MKKLSTIKRLLVGALALTMLAGSIAGCGGGDKKGAAKPAAGQTVKINFPTAGASGALYAVGAAITNNWSKTVPGVQAASQASFLLAKHRFPSPFPPTYINASTALTASRAMLIRTLRLSPVCI